MNDQADYSSSGGWYGLMIIANRFKSGRAALYNLA